MASTTAKALTAGLAGLGGGGGGGGSSAGKVRYTAPSGGLFADLFGVGTTLGKKGFAIGGPDAGNFNYAPSLFGGGGAGQSIADYLSNPYQIGGAGILARDFVDLLAPNALANFVNSSQYISPAVNEALATGFRTDVSPIAAQARRQFARSTVPQLAEQFAGTSGINSSDFGRNLLGSAADLEASIGALQTELDDAANARRLQALSVAPSAATILASAPAALGSEFANLEQLFRTQEEGVRPGARLLDFAFNTAGLNQGTSVQGPSNQGPSSAAQIIGAVQDPGGVFGNAGISGLFG